MTNPFEVRVPNALEALMAGDSGYNQGRQFAQDRALQQAGNLLSGGDYSGAAKELFKSGKIPEGLALLKLSQEQKNATAFSEGLGGLYGGGRNAGPAVSVSPNAPQQRSALEGLYSMPGANGWNVQNVNGQRVAINNTPEGAGIASPLDPPSNNERARLAALVQAEAGNQGATGMQAVANTVRNRAAESGLSVPQVIAQPGQFEPVGNGAINKYGPGTPGYDQASAAVDQAYTGNDPTRGAVNFYGRQAQADLAAKDGRPAVAKFDNGTGMDIGGQRFFTRADGNAPSSEISAQKAQTTQTYNDIGNERLQKLIGIAAQPGLSQEQRDTLNKLIDAEVKQSSLPDEIKKYHYAVKQGYKGTFEKWTEESDNRKQQKVTVNAFANPILKGIGERYNALADSAFNAPTAIQSIHEARNQLDQGVFSGAGADIKLSVAKIGAALGFDLPSDPIAATETFRSTMGGRVLQSLKVLGTNPSNTDRIFAEKIAGGDITLDEKSMRRLLAIDERSQREIIRRNNDYADKLQKASPEELGGYNGIMRVDEPGNYQPRQRNGGPPVPKIGDVLKGHRFNGGDPSQPSSWEKVQ